MGRIPGCGLAAERSAEGDRRAAEAAAPAGAPDPGAGAEAGDKVGGEADGVDGVVAGKPDVDAADPGAGAEAGDGLGGEADGVVGGKPDVDAAAVVPEAVEGPTAAAVPATVDPEEGAGREEALAAGAAPDGAADPAATPSDGSLGAMPPSVWPPALCHPISSAMISDFAKVELSLCTVAFVSSGRFFIHFFPDWNHKRCYGDDGVNGAESRRRGGCCGGGAGPGAGPG